MSCIFWISSAEEQLVNLKLSSSDLLVMNVPTNFKINLISLVQIAYTMIKIRKHIKLWYMYDYQYEFKRIIPSWIIASWYNINVLFIWFRSFNLETIFTSFCTINVVNNSVAQILEMNRAGITARSIKTRGLSKQSPQELPNSRSNCLHVLHSKVLFTLWLFIYNVPVYIAFKICKSGVKIR